MITIRTFTTRPKRLLVKNTETNLHQILSEGSEKFQRLKLPKSPIMKIEHAHLTVTAIWHQFLF